MYYGFKQQKQRGKTIEEIVKQHMQDRGHIVQDVSENPSFQKKDIDFILCNKDRTNYTTLEVKMDNNLMKTANFFFEMESEDENGIITKGWASYCEAEYICFYDSKACRGFVVAWTAVKPLLSTIGRVDYFYDRFDRKIRKAILVPIGILRKKDLIEYTWED